MSMGFGLSCCRKCNPCEIWCQDKWVFGNESDSRFNNLNPRVGPIVRSPAFPINVATYEDDQPVFSDFLVPINVSDWNPNGNWQSSQYADGMQGQQPAKDWFENTYHDTRTGWDYTVTDLWIDGQPDIIGTEIDYAANLIRHNNAATDFNVYSHPVPLNQNGFNKFSAHAFILDGQKRFSALYINDVWALNRDGTLQARDGETFKIVRASSPYLDLGNSEGCTPAFVRDFMMGTQTQARITLSSSKHGDFVDTINIESPVFFEFNRSESVSAFKEFTNSSTGQTFTLFGDSVLTYEAGFGGCSIGIREIYRDNTANFAERRLNGGAAVSSLLPNWRDNSTDPNKHVFSYPNAGLYHSAIGASTENMGNRTTETYDAKGAWETEGWGEITLTIELL